MIGADDRHTRKSELLGCEPTAVTGNDALVRTDDERNQEAEGAQASRDLRDLLVGVVAQFARVGFQGIGRNVFDRLARNVLDAQLGRGLRSGEGGRDDFDIVSSCWLGAPRGAFFIEDRYVEDLACQLGSRTSTRPISDKRSRWSSARSLTAH